MNNHLICIYFILIVLFSSLFYYFFNIHRKNSKYKENIFPDLIISVFACNRYNYLNQTLNTLFLHIKKYEKELIYNILYFDQGTIERNVIIKKFKLLNSFLLNPSGMDLSFDLLFSYIYTEYVFMLEEDWVVENNIENEIFYPSFIMESILILSKVDKIYGMILREERPSIVVENITVNTKMGNHILYIGYLWSKYVYTNGASIYKTKSLKILDRYNGELWVSIFFLKKGYKIGFTYKGRKGKKNDIYDQHVMGHIGFNSTSQLAICSISLY